MTVSALVEALGWSFLAIAGFTVLCGTSAAGLARAQAPKAPAVAYAIVSHDKDGVTRSGPGAPNKELSDLKTTLGKTYIWFRTAGKAYVVTDPATVAKAEALNQPVEDLARKQEEAGRPMAELSRQMEGLETKMRVAEREAEAGMRKLLQEALASGTAVPREKGK